MSLPSGDRMNPRDVAKAAAMTAEIHDVVISASKVLHRQPLDERDARALSWAREVLRLAESKDVMITMPSAQQLSGIGDAVVALRRAARHEHEDVAPGFSELRNSLDDVLGGASVEGSEDAMSSLRDLFALLSRALLQTEVMRHGEEPSTRPWELSRTSSSS